MADTRLNSMHLGLLPRRQLFRQARSELLKARGWITLAAEKIQQWMPEDAEWPSLLPVRLPFLPETKYLLLEASTAAAYPLQTGLNTMGRAPNNNLVFPESGVSRRHCTILVHRDDDCELHDTASLNGVRVNGQRVGSPVKLVSGDLIRISHRQLYFVAAEEYPGVLEGDPAGVTVVE